MFACVSVCGHVHMSVGAHRGQKCPPRVVVISCFEPPNVGSGYQAEVFWQNSVYS